MERDKLIKKELAKLNKLFSDLPKNKLELCEGLIQNAAFMKVTLLDLQKEILENGAVIPCTSGNGFETIKDNPAQKAYTTMISRYTVIIKQLSDFLPEEQRASKLEALINE